MTYGWHTATMIVAWAPWANWSPSALSHGRNIRHKWRGFRPYAGIDINHGVGELVAIGVSHGRNIRHKWRGFRPYTTP